MCCIRVSILMFHRRLTKGTYRRKWRIAIWSAIYFTGIYILVYVLMLVSNCNPPEAYWKALDPAYKKPYVCINTSGVNYAAGILSVVSDFYAICLPWAITRQLDVSRKQKIGLNMIFGCSMVVIVAAGFRTSALVALGHQYDSTWFVHPSGMPPSAHAKSSTGSDSIHVCGQSL